MYVAGGRTPTGLDAIEWVREVERRGAGEILLTSMDADGTKNGFDLELTRAVAEAVNIPVIASGGAGRLEHFLEAVTIGKAEAALAASLFHYNELTIADVKALSRCQRCSGAAGEIIGHGLHGLHTDVNSLIRESVSSVSSRICDGNQVG